MSYKITPNEFQIDTDAPTIRTRVPKDKITLDMVKTRASNANLLAGDLIRVMCMSFKYDQVLYEAYFLVSGAEHKIKHDVIDDRTERTYDSTLYTVHQWSPWKETPFGAEQAAANAGAERFVKGESKWNLGKKVFEVTVDEEVVFSSPDKGVAHAVAAGEAPIPAMEQQAA